jgi:hypothetical protein
MESRADNPRRDPRRQMHARKRTAARLDLSLLNSLELSVRVKAAAIADQLLQQPAELGTVATRVVWCGVVRSRICKTRHTPQ